MDEPTDYSKLTYQFYPLEEKILRIRLGNERDLFYVFRNRVDLTKTIIDDIEKRLRSPDSLNWVIIQINGSPGSKKSSVGITLMKTLIDYNFTAQGITQNYSKFEELLNSSGQGEGFVLDEMVFQYGTGSTRLANTIKNLIETLRQRQNSMIFITPTEKFISDNDVTFTLEPCGFNEEHKVVRCLVKKNFYIGFFYVKLMWGSDIWKDYQVQKTAFLEMTKNQKYDGYDFDQQAAKMMKDLPEGYFLNAKGKFDKMRTVLFVEKNSPNLTAMQRNLLIEQIKQIVEAERLSKIDTAEIKVTGGDEPSDTQRPSE